MSTTIPYDPSLTLGNICPKEKLDTLLAISQLQTPIDAAQRELDSALLLRRSLDMTAQELVNLQVDTGEVQKAVEDVNKEIADAAKRYATTSVANLPKIAEQRKKIAQVSVSVESPMDYNRSQLKSLPLAADSLTMDAQYFSFDGNKQSDDATMSTLKAFVSAQTSQRFGPDRSAQITTSVQSQVDAQRENHDIQGTLIITANCTHKAAEIFAPFIIDVDKAIRAWNEEFPDNMIKMDDPAAVRKLAKQSSTKDEKSMNLLSGATYGSSFVGMVHVLKQSATRSSQNMYAAAASLQAQMDVGGALKKMQGGFGVDASFVNSAKRLLSTQQISSHVSLVTMGVIPTIESHEVALSVKQFKDFDPRSMGDELATLRNATTHDKDSIVSAAEAARTGNQMVSLRSNDIQSALSAVAATDDGKNGMLDIQTLLVAFTDFVNKAIEGNVGVPINYYLKPITGWQLAQMWLDKYLPGPYITESGDDSESSADGGASSPEAA